MQALRQARLVAHEPVLVLNDVPFDIVVEVLAPVAPDIQVTRGDSFSAPLCFLLTIIVYICDDP